jgi:hypothetical protein
VGVQGEAAVIRLLLLFATMANTLVKDDTMIPASR